METSNNVFGFPKYHWIFIDGTQHDFMVKDNCIVVNEDDIMIGNKTKKECHIFTDEQSGILHRAFSVFLFDEQNRLLLQKRAATKFTFPETWTNTCCSHPLTGLFPSEVDLPEAIENGTVPGKAACLCSKIQHFVGIKTAAIRKLNHELGIPISELNIDDFKYLTRMHYCASDVKQENKNWAWGEHELDYILFIQKPVTLQINPEEVSDVRYVHPEELNRMMASESGLKWSPWFRIIAKNFLNRWWTNLDRVLSTDVYVDLKTIHRLDVDN